MAVTPIPTDDLQTSIGSDPDIERLYDNVQLTLPGVTVSAIKLAAWNALEEFALRSTYFRDRVYWTMPSAVSTVDFNPYSSDMAACWVLDLIGLYRWRVQPPALLIDLTTPSPQTQRNGEALLALKPLSLESELPSGFWSLWFETMLDGTLFRLHGLPGKPWSSPQLAQYHGSRFRSGLNRARDISNRSNSYQAPPWRFPYFATGQRKM